MDSVNGNLILTYEEDGIEKTKEIKLNYPLYARLPIHSSDATITEVDQRSIKKWIYENLDTTGLAPEGYWTLSTQTYGTNYALFVGYVWYVPYFGGVGNGSLPDAARYGIRPVITLNL